MKNVKNCAFEIEYLHVYSQAGKKCVQEIIKGISLKVEAGKSLAIVGESGCGKTMTAMSVFRLLPPNCFAKGKISLGDLDLLEVRNINAMRGREIVLIPQSGREFLNPVFKVQHQMYETFQKLGVQKNLWLDQASGLLRSAGFDNPDYVLDKYPFELSGGMAQRVILAIGMAAEPALVIADEPTRGVDQQGVQLFIDRLRINFAKAALVIITHNMGVARSCDDILVMYQGEVMEYGESAEILEHSTHPYTRSLILALPDSRNFFDVPELQSRSFQVDSEHCSYYARCEAAIDACAGIHPTLSLCNGTQRRCLRA